jgi:phage terminase large subunit-like protein
MVEGESGILSVCPPWNRPAYEPSKRRLTWPNGALATLYSADEPERLRGPQSDGAWCDEPASWRYPEAWDMLMFGLRLGSDPRVVVTGTPKPIKIIKELLQSPTTHVVRGSTYANRRNLSPVFFSQIVKKYEGTRMGRQELQAEILDDNPNALWRRDDIERTRVTSYPDLTRSVVAIDPAVTDDEGSAETGIVVAGVSGAGEYYILDDRSLRSSPRGWATAAITAFHTYHGDRIVGEANNGGDMIEALLRTVDKEIPFKKVTATRGKAIRAEPIASLYERGIVHHVGTFPALEDQLCEWDPSLDGPSPDRLDACVWALTELSERREFLWESW